MRLSAFRRALSLGIAVALIFSQVSPAEAKIGEIVPLTWPAFQATAHSFLTSTFFLRRVLGVRAVISDEDAAAQYHEFAGKRLDELGKKSAPMELMKSGVETAFMLMGFQVLGVVQQRLHQATLKGEKVSLSEIKQICMDVAPQVLSSGSVWTGFFGSGLAGVAAEKTAAQPGIQVMTNLLANKATHPIVSSMLGGMAFSLISNLGWIGFSSVWDFSRLMIRSDPSLTKEQREEYYAASDNLFQMSSEWVYSGKAGEAMPGRVALKLIFRNMGKIFFTNPELLGHLLFNAWRNQIATGDFASMVVLMAAGSVGGGALGGAIGTAVVPGAGTAVLGAFGLVGGMIGGVVGGVVASNTPIEVKEYVSLQMKEARSIWNGGFLDDNLLELESTLADPSAFLDAMKERARRREHIMSIYFETFFMLRYRLEVVGAEIQIASQTLKLMQDQANTPAKRALLNLEGSLKDGFLSVGGGFIGPEIGSGPFGLGVFSPSLKKMICMKLGVYLAYSVALSEIDFWFHGDLYQEELQVFSDLEQKAPAGKATHMLIRGQYADLRWINAWYQKMMSSYLREPSQLRAADERREALRQADLQRRSVSNDAVLKWKEMGFDEAEILEMREKVRKYNLDHPTQVTVKRSK